MNTEKTRILIADDHMLMRMGLSTLLACEEDLVVVGEATNGREAVERAATLKPDLIIMDLMMPELAGGAATRLIHEANPKIKILILTSYATSKEMSEAIANGADGALMKDTAADDLIATIRALLAGERRIPECLLRQAQEDTTVPDLPASHLEILQALAEGLSNADIAQRFDVAEITIKKKISTILERLGVSNRTEAVALALRKQMLAMD